MDGLLGRHAKKPIVTFVNRFPRNDAAGAAIGSGALELGDRAHRAQQSALILACAWRAAGLDIGVEMEVIPATRGPLEASLLALVCPAACPGTPLETTIWMAFRLHGREQ